MRTVTFSKHNTDSLKRLVNTPKMHYIQYTFLTINTRDSYMFRIVLVDHPQRVYECAYNKSFKPVRDTLFE